MFWIKPQNMLEDNFILRQFPECIEAQINSRRHLFSFHQIIFLPFWTPCIKIWSLFAEI